MPQNINTAIVKTIFITTLLCYDYSLIPEWQQQTENSQDYENEQTH